MKCIIFAPNEETLVFLSGSGLAGDSEIPASCREELETITFPKEGTAGNAELLESAPLGPREQLRLLW